MNNDFMGPFRMLHSIDWDDQAFSIEKAYLAAMFSRLAYLHVPDFEVGNGGRIKVVPCEAFQEIVSKQIVVSLPELLRTNEIEEFFIVARRYAVVLVIRTPKAIFIAIRGTKHLYDWVTNLKVSKVKAGPLAGRVKFHRGFYKAITACIPEVDIRLQTWNIDVPIYIVGHSLGGAMAAIMNAIWSIRVPVGFFHEGPIMRIKPCHSSYVFGMPRYGNDCAVDFMPSPNHIYNIGDPVPEVPPRWLGYANCLKEYTSNGNGLELRPRNDSVKFASWIASLLIGHGIKLHQIETYLSELEVAVATGDPDEL